jgi:hypothetical protein
LAQQPLAAVAKPTGLEPRQAQDRKPVAISALQLDQGSSYGFLHRVRSGMFMFRRLEALFDLSAPARTGNEAVDQPAL